MTRRKLLLVAPSAYALGGVANWLDYLVPGLESEGWVVTVGLTSGRHHDVARYLAVHPFATAVSIPCGTGTREARISHMCRAIRRVAPDLTGFVNLPETAVAANRLRRSGRLPGRVALLKHGFQHDLFADMRLLKPQGRHDRSGDGHELLSGKTARLLW